MELPYEIVKQAQPVFHGDSTTEARHDWLNLGCAGTSLWELLLSFANVREKRNVFFSHITILMSKTSAKRHV